MNLAKFSNADLITLHDRPYALRTGCIDKTFVIADKEKANIFSTVEIKDDRLNDLLWNLFVETYNELCSRFSKRIELEKEKEPPVPVPLSAPMGAIPNDP